MNADAGLSEYNGFCKDLRAGNILYNIDSTNMWGEYLLVAHVTSVMVGDKKTYTALLICMEKKDGSYIPLNRCISQCKECSFSQAYRLLQVQSDTPVHRHEG